MEHAENMRLTTTKPGGQAASNIDHEVLPVKSKMDGNYSQEPFIIQPKLTVGAPNDAYEKEADAMADKVMRMPEQNFVQRKCAECEEEKNIQRKPISTFLQLKSNAANNTVNPVLANQINTTKGSGRNLDAPTKTFMETRFGSNFSQVKIHACSEAVQMSEQLNAKAFTVGNDIYFNEGQYRPADNEGKQLLAHELTHTIQQKGNTTIQRWAISGNTATADNEEDSLGMLSVKIGATANDWKCIRPIKMKTSEMAKPPADFNDNYERYVQIGDQFDISNLKETEGSSLKLYLFDDSSEKMHADLAKLFYPGSKSSLDVDTDFDSTADSGKKPIGNVLLFGHAGGNTMWGDATIFTPTDNNSEEPKHSFVLANAGLMPRRCWLTRNVIVRSVGCNSEAFGKGFANTYMRKGSRITTTTEAVRPKCSTPNYNAAKDVCKSFDGLDFGASSSKTAKSLEGPFWSVTDFHAASYWKEIKGKL